MHFSTKEYFILPLKTKKNRCEQCQRSIRKWTKKYVQSPISLHLQIQIQKIKMVNNFFFFLFTCLFHFCSFLSSLLWSTGLKWVDYVTIWKKYQFITPCSAFRRKYVKGDKIYYPTYALSTTMNSVLDLFPNKE